MKKGFIRKVGASFATLLSLVSCLNSVSAKLPDIPKENLKAEDKKKTGELVCSLTDFLAGCHAEGIFLCDKLKNFVRVDKSFKEFGVGFKSPKDSNEPRVFLKYKYKSVVKEVLGGNKIESIKDSFFEVDVTDEPDLKIQVFLTPEEYVKIEDLLKFGKNDLLNSKNQNIKNFMKEVDKIKNPKPVEEKNEKIQLVNEEKNEKIQPEIEGKSENSFNTKWLLTLLAVPPILYGMNKVIDKTNVQKEEPQKIVLINSITGEPWEAPDEGEYDDEPEVWVNGRWVMGGNESWTR